MPANPVSGGGGSGGPGVPPGVGVGIGGSTSWWVIDNPGFPFDIGIVASILGIHGKYALERSATKPTGVTVEAGPFKTKADANAWISAHNPFDLPKVTAGDFLGRLSQASTWERVALAALGVILLAIGAARITGTQNAISSVVKARIP